MVDEVDTNRSTRATTEDMYCFYPASSSLGLAGGCAVMEARLGFLGHALMENRHGLVVDACLTQASGLSAWPRW